MEVRGIRTIGSLIQKKPGLAAPMQDNWEIATLQHVVEVISQNTSIEVKNSAVPRPHLHTNSINPY